MGVESFFLLRADADITRGMNNTGATHVLVLRSFPDGAFLPKSLLGLFELVIAPRLPSRCVCMCGWVGGWVGVGVGVGVGGWVGGWVGVFVCVCVCVCVCV